MLGRSDKETITVKDVPADNFINAFATHLKDTNKVVLPENYEILKTGSGKQVSPYDSNWYYIRMAAVLRKIYLRPNLGVSTLQHIFGNRKNWGHSKYHHAKGAGKIIRNSLAQLEKLGLVEKENNRETKIDSRIVSKQGRKEMNNIAKKVFKELLESNR